MPPRSNALKIKSGTFHDDVDEDAGDGSVSDFSPLYVLCMIAISVTPPPPTPHTEARRDAVSMCRYSTHITHYNSFGECMCVCVFACFQCCVNIIFMRKTTSVCAQVSIRRTHTNNAA